MNSFINNLNIVLCLLFLTGCTSNDKTQQGELENKTYLIGIKDNTLNDSVKIKFKSSTTIDFGKIKVGDTVRRVFTFENIGKKPFLINSATATCGCTVAYFNVHPIAVGMTDSIVATFISDGNMNGHQSKVVTVDCNSPLSPFLLTMNGIIE